ncbi:MAG TPA: zinc ribbon domain-containing protein [Dissulfurispiraceae bacterium]|jgi:putative FmdB family regulatory protein|nr:zinc ribbon domain-containing protein [Dissulfurispiraceae bacterium]
MPIYEYVCRKCDEQFSLFQSIYANEKDTRCPKCGADDVKKKISGFSCLSFGGYSSAGSAGGGGGG